MTYLGLPMVMNNVTYIKRNSPSPLTESPACAENLQNVMGLEPQTIDIYPQLKKSTVFY